jgi:ATP-dependent DNA helicase RecQ
MMEACEMLVRHPDDGGRMAIQMLTPPRGTREALQGLIELRDRQARLRLDKMVEYAASDSCRHALLVRHFGQSMAHCRSSCDNCLGTPVGAAAAVTAEAIPDDISRTILETVPRLPFGLGRSGLAKVLHGSADAAIGADRCRAFGSLSGLTRTAVSRAIDALIGAGLLEIEPDDEYRRVRLTAEGARRASAAQPVLPAPTAAAPPRTTRARRERPRTGREGDRFEALRALRLKIARGEGIPAFMVFHDTVLAAIAQADPASESELLAVPGVGPAKSRRYGAAFLALLSELRSSE